MRLYKVAEILGQSSKSVMDTLDNAGFFVPSRRTPLSGAALSYLLKGTEFEYLLVAMREGCIKSQDSAPTVRCSYFDLGPGDEVELPVGKYSIEAVLSIPDWFSSVFQVRGRIQKPMR